MSLCLTASCFDKHGNSGKNFSQRMQIRSCSANSLVGRANLENQRLPLVTAAVQTNLLEQLQGFHSWFLSCAALS